MKSKKTYVIRKYAYHYSDEHLYVHTKGAIEEILHDEAQAIRKLAILERKAFENMDLGDIENLSLCSNNFWKKARSFKFYYKEQFGEDIVTADKYGNLYCERDTYLPKGLTDEQIMNIRSTSGIKFYELSEFAGEPKFFGIWKKWR